MGGMTLALSLGGLRNEQAREVIERRLVIIGGGPAGLTAALYAGRAQLQPLVLIGQSLGGQAASTAEMENYPGFPEGIGGMALTDQMARQATRFGAELGYEEATEVDLRTWPFCVRTVATEYVARAVIVCTGAKARHLGVPGETRFVGRGVSFCATCDGYFYRDKTIVVVGGGDSALDEGLYLTRFARQVTIVHRRDQLRASALLQQRALANPKIRFVWNSVVEEVLGDKAVTGVRLRNVQTGVEGTVDADGLFVYIGFVPNSALFKGQLAMTEEGYLVTDRRQRTSVEGVYAAGDVQDPHFRQAVIAAGAGAAAAIEAQRFLAEKDYEDQEASATGCEASAAVTPAR